MKTVSVIGVFYLQATLYSFLTFLAAIKPAAQKVEEDCNHQQQQLRFMQCCDSKALRGGFLCIVVQISHHFDKYFEQTLERSANEPFAVNLNPAYFYTKIKSQ